MRTQVAAVVGVLVAVTIAACGGRDPTGPTPSPVSVSVSIAEVTPNPVGTVEHVCATCRLSRPRAHAVEIQGQWTRPNGESFTFTVSFPIGVTDRTHTGPAPIVGDWTVRILGEQLPEGVVLGSPSSVTITVLAPPFASGVDCR